MLFLLILLESKGHNAIRTMVRALLSDMAMVVFAETHPWRQIFSHIGKIKDSHLFFHCD